MTIHDQLVLAAETAAVFSSAVFRSPCQRDLLLGAPSSRGVAIQHSFLVFPPFIVCQRVKHCARGTLLFTLLPTCLCASMHRCSTHVHVLLCIVFASQFF